MCLIASTYPPTHSPTRWPGKALLLAAEGGHAEAISALLAAGANINATNKAGASALHEAAYHGKTAAVELLVNSGSNLVIRDADGNTVRARR